MDVGTSSTVSIGEGSLQILSISTGANIGIGYASGWLVTSGVQNVLLGVYSGGKLTTGSYNTLIGSQDYYSDPAVVTSGDFNSTLGYGAKVGVATGDYQTAIGAMAECTAEHQIMLGTASEDVVCPGGMSSPTFTTANILNVTNKCTALGISAGTSAAPISSVAIGYQCGDAMILATANCTFAGYQCGTLCTGATNSGFGSGALDSLTSGQGNTAFGYKAANAVSNNHYTVAVGYQALNSINATANTAVGFRSNYSGYSSTHCTSVGYQSLRGGGNDYCTALGSSALYACSASGNTGVGYKAGYSGVSSTYCTSVGMESLMAGGNDYTTAIGTRALRTATGSYCTALGANAGFALTTGGYNTFIGASDTTATIVTTGGRCTTLGANTVLYASSAYMQTAIGYGATCTANYQIALGTSTETVVCRGDFERDNRVEAYVYLTTAAYSFCSTGGLMFANCTLAAGSLGVSSDFTLTTTGATAGRLQYTGTKTRRFRYMANITRDTDGSNQPATVTTAINGTWRTEATISAQCYSSWDFNMLVIDHFELEEDDYVDLIGTVQYGYCILVRNANISLVEII